VMIALGKLAADHMGMHTARFLDSHPRDTSPARFW
jgi:hypothetical protein